VKINSHHKAPRSFTGHVAIFAAAACWGASGIFVKFIADNEAVSAIALAFWRDFTTFICLLLLGLAAIPGKLRIRRIDWRYVAGMGASLGVFHIVYNLGVVLNGAAVTTIQQAIMPAIVTVAARYLWQEPLTRRKILAVVLAFAGAVLVAGPTDIQSSEVTPAGLISGLSVPFCYALWTLFVKRVRMQYDSLVVLIFAFGLASALLLPLQFFVPQPWPVQPTTWLWFAGLIGLSTLSAFFLYAVGIGRLQAGIASILLMSEIVFAVIYAYILLGERLAMAQITGSVLVVSGVLLLLRKYA